jgi:pyruvate/2-oxoglutarate dehydrogenase complex dihydrolipoamide dehydrogenase (E3) component
MEKRAKWRGSIWMQAGLSIATGIGSRATCAHRTKVYAIGDVTVNASRVRRAAAAVEQRCSGCRSYASRTMPWVTFTDQAGHVGLTEEAARSARPVFDVRWPMAKCAPSGGQTGGTKVVPQIGKILGRIAAHEQRMIKCGASPYKKYSAQ